MGSKRGSTREAPWKRITHYEVFTVTYRSSSTLRSEAIALVQESGHHHHRPSCYANLEAASSASATRKCPKTHSFGVGSTPRAPRLVFLRAATARQRRKREKAPKLMAILTDHAVAKDDAARDRLRLSQAGRASDMNNGVAIVKLPESRPRENHPEKTRARHGTSLARPKCGVRPQSLRGEHLARVLVVDD